eukprot:4791434-Pyramimonas_sp.AAC.1
MTKDRQVFRRDWRHVEAVRNARAPRRSVRRAVAVSRTSRSRGAFRHQSNNMFCTRLKGQLYQPKSSKMLSSSPALHYHPM